VNPYAVKYGLGRAWGYTALTLGMWLVFWFHRTRKLLDGELGRGRDDALLHSIGLLVPVWNIFVLYGPTDTWTSSDALHRLPEIPVAAYVAGGALAPAIMYSVVLGNVNEFWDVRTQGLATHAPITGGEKLLLSIGVAIWVMGSVWLLLIVLLFFSTGPLIDMV
jgi:hypothetical protein